MIISRYTGYQVIFFQTEQGLIRHSSDNKKLRVVFIERVHDCYVERIISRFNRVNFGDLLPTINKVCWSYKISVLLAQPEETFLGPSPTLCILGTALE